MTKLTLLLAAAVVLSVSACDNDPSKGKTKVQGKDPVLAPTAAPAGAKQLSFSASGSKIEWTGAKVTRKHDGSFTDFSGTIDLVDNDPTKSRVSVDITMSSLSVEPEKLASHLKSDDFFDVAKFPKASFVSTSIKAGGEKGASHTVTGNLTMHGVTKSISFPATIRVSGDAASVNAEFAINRKDFGVVYTGQADDLIKDEVAIKLTLAAKGSSAAPAAPAAPKPEENSGY